MSLTVIIPSKGSSDRKERFLWNTVEDVLKHAAGEVEVIVGLDGYEDKPDFDDPRLTIFSLPASKHNQKRQVVNHAVEMAQGDHIMSLDAHCLLDYGFDLILAKHHEPNWVQVPRRLRLDPVNWCVSGGLSLPYDEYQRLPIDYEYIMWEPVQHHRGFHGYKWNARTLTRFDHMIDDIMTFQGSCWFMTKEWYKERGFMQVEGYQGWGQEAEEISFETWLNGGRVVVNKHTYYAHLHKGLEYGRMYFLNKQDNDKCYAYSYDLWAHKRRDWFESFIERWMPLPKWPADWRRYVYG